MATNFIQDGKTINWTNSTGSAVASGQVVAIGQVIGVTLIAIDAGAVGSVMVQGVFTAPKVTTAVIAAGESLLWDVSAGKFDAKSATPATGDISGAPAYAVEAAGNGATTMKVMLTGVPGTKT